MAERARLQEIIAQLNDALGEVTPYKLGVVPPGDLRPASKNAHYMPKVVYDRLVANVEQDKNLSSLPFCWKNEKGDYIVLSGNHRVMAAKDAGVELMLILYTDRALSRPEQVAIQLSHNALVGEDNPAILRELWQEITRLDLKIYSGLDEMKLQAVEPAHVQQIAEAQLRFETLTLLFMPAEIEQMQEVVERLASFKGHCWAGALDDFDRFFEALLDFKEAANVLNTATAFRMLIEIAGQWIAKEQQAHAAGQG